MSSYRNRIKLSSAILAEQNVHARWLREALGFPRGRSRGHLPGGRNFENRRLALMLGAASVIGSILGTAHPAFSSSLTNTVVASTASPYSSTDPTGQSVSFTSLSIANFATASPSIPNGLFSSLVGTANGTIAANGTILSNGVTTSDSGNSVYTAFEYDSNGFRLIGQYTTCSTGAYSQANLYAVTPDGSVLGGEGRSSTNSTSTGILGNETWLSTPTSPGATTATDTYLGIFTAGNSSTTNFVTEYTVATSAFPATSGTYSYQHGYGLAGGYAVGTTNLCAGDNNPAIGQALSQSSFHGIISTAYVSSGTSLGQEAWIQTATSASTQIGLYGSGNYYALYTPASLNSGTSTYVGNYYSNGLVGVNSTGTAIGSASAYSNAASAPGTSLGTDGWLYNGTTTVPVGMYNSGQTITVASYSGGASSTYTFYYSPTSNVGTTPNTSQGRSTSLYYINPSGVVAGNSSYYQSGATSSSAQGSVAFTYNASSGTYIPLAFTNSSFTTAAYPLPAGATSFVNSGSSSTVGQVNSFPVAINASGTVTGKQTTYVGEGGTATYTASGQAAWSATPAGVLTQIGLYNQGPTSNGYNIHQNSANFGTYSDTPQFINSKGLIAGNALRFGASYASLGNDAWVYDPSAGTTYAIDPTDENSTNYVAENVQYLSDTGFVVGQYRIAASSSAANSTPWSTFIWSDAAPLTSFTVLNGYDVSGLSSSGFQNLVNSYYVDPTGYLSYETATATGSSTNAVTGLVTVVPEPTSLSLVALGLCGLARHRRRSLVDSVKND